MSGASSAASSRRPVTVITPYCIRPPTRRGGQVSSMLETAGPPAECGAELRRDVGEDLDVVLPFEREGQRERDLVDLAERGVGIEPFGDLRAGADEIRREHDARRSV